MEDEFNIEEIAYFIPARIYERAESYYRQGAVSKLREIAPGEWMARVEVNMEDEYVISWHCDCPYDGEICKHVGAVLMYIQDRMDEEDYTSPISCSPDNSKCSLTIKDAPDEECLKLSNTIDKERFLDFVCRYASGNEVFRKAFLREFRVLENDTIIDEDIIACFDHPYDDDLYRPYYLPDVDTYVVVKDLTAFHTKAMRLVEEKKYEKGITLIFRLLSVIGDQFMELDLENCEDNDLHDFCEKLATSLIDIARIKELPENIKDFILDEIENLKNDEVFEDYDLFDINDTTRELTTLLRSPLQGLEFIDKVLQESPDQYNVHVYVLHRIGLLRQLDRVEEIESTIEKYLYLNPIRLYKVEQLLKEEEYGKALKLIEDAICIENEKAFPQKSFSDWEEKKLEVYKLAGRIEEAVVYAKELFMRDKGSYELYKILKKLVVQELWKDFYEELITDKRFDPYHLSTEADIYVAEKDMERLFVLLKKEANASFSMLMTYGPYVKDKYDTEILDLLDPHFREYAEKNVSRSNYEYLKEKLKKLEIYPKGPQKIRELVDFFRIKYKRRPAMMEVLSSI